jgi:hypothetical protein
MKNLDVIEVGLRISLAATRRFLQFHTKPIRWHGVKPKGLVEKISI